jgi:hypothetical protein
MKLLWKTRRRIASLLESAPLEKRAALLAALRGVDLLLRTNFENRKGGRWVERN